MAQGSAVISPPFVLHVWPGAWNLPSVDPSCLSAILLLQRAIPGNFSISRCTNPDLSPSGQLPFLTHDQHTVSPLPAIVKYISGLKRSGSLNTDLDATLNTIQRAQSLAWSTYVLCNIGDLVYTMLYSISTNWAELTHPTFVSFFPIPQSYYVPNRIRSSYVPRLEAAGLWTLPPPEPEPKKLFGQVREGETEPRTQTFHRAYERQKILDKARASLGIFNRLLEDKEFIYSNRITTIDILLSSHVLFIINPKYPDPLIQNLVMSTYPALVDHAHRVYEQITELALPSAESIHANSNLWSLLPRFPTCTVTKTRRNPDEVRSDRLRWGFFGLAIGSIIAYFAILGSPILIVINVPRASESENRGENQVFSDSDAIGVGEDAEE